jgi:hypothetical protein
MLVMRGLDPRIHLKWHCFYMMDCRIKSGNDAVRHFFFHLS